MKWRIPVWAQAVNSPFGRLAIGNDGVITANSAEVDEWLREQGALQVSPDSPTDGLIMQMCMEADRPEASTDNAGKLVFVRDRRSGQLHFSSGESLTPVAPPLDVNEAWGPADLTGLVEGWIADDLVGANASAVRGWIGLNGMTLIQPSAGSRPLLYTTDASKMINGRQVVTFDGSNDSLNLSGLADPFALPTWSVLAICRPSPPGATEGALWSSADEGGANTWVWGGYDITATAKHVFRQRNAGDTEDVLTGPDVAATPQVIEWTSDGASTALRIKHAVQTLTVTSGANNGHGFRESVGRDNFSIGTRKLAGESRNWRGDLAALFILSHISPSERGQLFAWIAANYAVGL